VAARLTVRLAATVRRATTAVLIGAVRAYQWGISPWLGPRCRFEPTCSAYALAALRRHGPLRGGLLALKRLARCHPWAATGYDPVPEELGKDGTSP